MAKGARRNGAVKVTLKPEEHAKIAARAERFGTQSDEQKTKLRAARFGTFNPELEKEKANKRRERFSTGAAKSKIGSVEETPEEQEKRKLRAKRFGVPCAALDAEKKKQRAERFGIGNEIDTMNKHLAGRAGKMDEEPEASAEKEEGLIDEEK
eukprot:Gregarina_sp_Pseudo_9__2847@NODE_3076_length_760_cov_7_968100_g2806_i0_p1_GENE_NODE_3076_length_760_cov_7_968100_g2806_i0NODE_3076_length_760_cov_7_968100_g2806_i0_p1_ORF_typecomplete_len153_score21_94Tho1_MOS11_C/PF18592_1/0_0013Tho1_MOS11_C/PF18592_1/2_3e06Tho1_MOS11_C/PF18592_1/0_037Tho1_MOS11_C/PF18592_1/6_3e11LPD22/PF18834_1/0_15LPD22/PF18834_1/63DUF3106/PF11304_8/0_043DUF3106/PF11304_8/78_NODE_3076_length_760_cov_7_968100_g2806_i015473